MSMAELPPENNPAVNEPAVPQSFPALQQIIKGLAGDPLLLAGFAALLVVGTLAQVMDSALMPAGWLVLGVYSITVVAWVASRGPRRTPRAPKSTVKGRIRGSKGTKINNSGNIYGAGSGPRKVGMEITDSEDTEITGSGNIGGEGPR